MSNLNEQQFAKYSSLSVPDPIYETKTIPLPVSMERHAPGEYQPTLPGMEKMLKGEQTHSSVFFKHPNESETYVNAKGETAYSGEVKGSNWWFKTRNHYPENVKARASSLRPTQDWMDDNYLHSEPHGTTVAQQGLTPKVERIGRKNVIHDGHHRAVREIMKGSKRIEIERY
jgi:hypothetical protein